MNRTRKWRVSVIVATLAVSVGMASALAGEIYRYTDANGEVHYGDQPSGEASEERLAISSKPTDPSQVQARISQRQQAAATPAAEPDPDDEKAAPLTRSERKAKAREQQQKCQEYRDRLETYVTSRRLYRQDENGERVYLDESETQQARSKVEELIVENCT